MGPPFNHALVARHPRALERRPDALLLASSANQIVVKRVNLVSSLLMSFYMVNIN